LEGGDTLNYGGREYAIGGHQITRTKTTKTTKTAISSDGSVRVLPGSTRVTTYRNSTSFASELPDRFRHDGDLGLQFSSSSSSRSSGGYGSSSSSSSFNELESEDAVYDYEEEDFMSSANDRGIQLSREDQVHPLELRGFGVPLSGIQ